MKNLENVKVGMNVKRINNSNPFMRITKISKFNIFIKPTNYPSSPFKVSISDFLNTFEIVKK